MFNIFKNFSYSLLVISYLVLTGCGSDNTNNSLEYIPADSIMYIGAQEPFPIKEALIWSQKTFPIPKSVYSDFKAEPDPESSAIEKFFTLLAGDYIQLYFEPEKLEPDWGIAANNQLSFYTLGVIPVLRLNLSNKERFINKIKSFEKQAGLTSEAHTLEQAQYHRYKTEDEYSDMNVDFIIAYDKNDVIITFDLHMDDDTLAIALGQKKPQKSLASIQQIELINEKYQFGEHALTGFINQKELINGLTSIDANRLAKTIYYFEQYDSNKSSKDKSAHNNKKTSPLDELRTPECRNDMLAITDNWPRTVFGYKKFDLKSDPAQLDAMLIVETNDQVFLEGLETIKGFIPEFVHNDTDKLFAIGLGLDIDNVIPFMIQQLNELKKKPYQCSLLLELQTTLKGIDPSVLGLATMMVKGIKGISMTLNQIEGDFSDIKKLTGLKQVDATITLTANDPKSLFQTAQAFIPGLGSIEIPDDGSAFELPLPLPNPLPNKQKVMAIVKDEHIAIYTGETATKQAQNLATMSVKKSVSFMEVVIDYGKYYDLLGSFSPADIEVDPVIQEMFNSLKETDLIISESIRTSSNGLIMDVKMSVPAKKSK